MNEKRFDPARLNKLNNPARLKDIPPDYLWANLGLGRAEVLVEIGAGTALFSVAFLQHVPTATVYACDVSEALVEWVREHIAPEHPQLVPMKSRENTVPLEDALADLVFMINVYHELDDSLAVAKEAYRISKPGGKILVVDWKKQEMPEGPPLAIRWLPEQVTEQLAEVGFIDLTSHEDLPKHFVVVGRKKEWG